MNLGVNPTTWTDTVLTFDGNDGRPVHRPARVVRTPDTLWLIATETGPGLTIPNGIEAVWRAVRRRWPDDRVRLIVHTPPSGPAAGDKWEEAVPAPGHVVTWYAPWGDDAMVMMFGRDLVPFHPAHQPVDTAALERYARIGGHLGALRRQVAPAGRRTA